MDIMRKIAEFLGLEYELDLDCVHGLFSDQIAADAHLTVRCLLLQAGFRKVSHEDSEEVWTREGVEVYVQDLFRTPKGSKLQVFGPAAHLL